MVKTAVDFEQARKRIEELTALVEQLRFNYYVLDRTDVSDADFDKFFVELQTLEKDYPELALPNSPTQKVGAPPSTDFKQIRHRVPLMSLANAMNREELEKWAERLYRTLGDGYSADALSFVSELKIDGLSIALTYKNGTFVEGATRGNGEVGEDVTNNLKTIAALPTKLKPIEFNGQPYMPELIEVRGEVYLPISSFNELNAVLAEEGEPTFANPRNAASGALRQKDPKKTAKRKLGLWCYFIYITDPNMKEPSTQFENLELLKNLGFPVETGKRLCRNVDEVIKFCDDFQDKRHSLDYQTDGVVVKVNERDLWGTLGATSHSPRWAIAFKYPPEESDTLIEDIHFDVGRTGAVTPVAWLKPVQLAGTTVKRATLHNAEQIKRLDVRIGDTVVVRKAGEIIPEVLYVRVEKRPEDSQPFVYPTKCPICATSLERIGQEVVFRCPNVYGCQAQIERRIDHWVGRDAMDIDGVGSSLIQQLVQSNLISNPADLYKLTEETLSQLERMGKKSAQNILSGIAASKARPLPNLIFALGIRHVGSSGAELLADKFHSLLKLSTATAEDIAQIEGIGPKIAATVIEYFSHPENQSLIEELKQQGVSLEYSESDRPEQLAQIFVGKSFVITGTMETMDRTEAEKSVKARGGKVSSSVSKKTDYVVVGASPGSKLAKAQELGINVIDEAEFKRLLSEMEVSG